MKSLFLSLLLLTAFSAVPSRASAEPLPGQPPSVGNVQSPEQPPTAGNVQSPEQPPTAGKVQSPEQPPTAGKVQSPEQPPTAGNVQSPPAPEQALAKVQFTCGEAGDPSSNQNLPATVANVTDNPETIVLIVWKSEFFGGKFTPKKRCEIVSAAIGKAFSEGRTHIGSGKDKATGLGLVCGVANPDQQCDRTNMILTMKSYQSADDTIDQIGQIMQGKTGQPVYQSTGGKRVNLRNLLLKSKVR